MEADGSDDPKKGTQLLEVYALEIQMHSEQVCCFTVTPHRLWPHLSL